MQNLNNFPKTVVKPAQCPNCGKEFDYTVYPEITIPGNNKLKKQVMNKVLFYPKCPACGEEFKIKADCIYRNDTKKEIFVVTEHLDADFESLLKTGDINLSDVKTEDDMTKFMGGQYKRRLVYDVDAFREKILLSDNNYDDRIIELMKLSLSGMLEKDTSMPVYRIYLDDTAGNVLQFTAIMGAFPPFEYIFVKTPSMVYTQFKKDYFDKLGMPEADEYILTNQEWAAKSGLLKDGPAGFVIPLQ